MNERVEVSLAGQSVDVSLARPSDGEMAQKLEAAGKQAEVQKAQRRERTVKGSHLSSRLEDMVQKFGLQSVEKSGFHKVSGPVKGRTIYLARKGGRADISGFNLDLPGIKQISETEAKEKHLGKVRGQIDFSQADEVVLETFSAALKKLQAE